MFICLFNSFYIYSFQTSFLNTISSLMDQFYNFEEASKYHILFQTYQDTYNSIEKTLTEIEQMEINGPSQTYQLSQYSKVITLLLFEYFIYY